MESYSDRVNKNLDDVIKDFVSDLSKKYKLDKTELYSMWKDVYGDNKREDDVESGDEKEKYMKELGGKKKTELVKICDELELDVKGNKKDLIKRIVNEKFNTENIIKSINSSVDSIIINRNKFNNYEHVPTKFVFNHHTKTVIGKQMDDGKVIQLNRQDIELCNQYKFKYNIPTDLGGVDDDDEIGDDFSEYSDESDDEDD